MASIGGSGGDGSGSGYCGDGQSVREETRNRVEGGEGEEEGEGDGERDGGRGEWTEAKGGEHVDGRRGGDDGMEECKPRKRGTCTHCTCKCAEKNPHRFDEKSTWVAK